MRLRRAQALVVTSNDSRLPTPSRLPLGTRPSFFTSTLGARDQREHQRLSSPILPQAHLGRRGHSGESRRGSPELRSSSGYTLGLAMASILPGRNAACAGPGAVQQAETPGESDYRAQPVTCGSASTGIEGRRREKRGSDGSRHDWANDSCRERASSCASDHSLRRPVQS